MSSLTWTPVPEMVEPYEHTMYTINIDGNTHIGKLSSMRKKLRTWADSFVQFDSEYDELRMYFDCEDGSTEWWSTYTRDERRCWKGYVCKHIEQDTLPYYTSRMMVYFPPKKDSDDEERVLAFCEDCANEVER